MVAATTLTSNDNNDDDDDTEQWLDVLCTRAQTLSVAKSVVPCCCRSRGCCTHWKIINKLDKLQHLINYVFCVRFSTCYVCESMERFDVYRNCFHLYQFSTVAALSSSVFRCCTQKMASFTSREIDVDFLIHINSSRRRDARFRFINFIQIKIQRRYAKWQKLNLV